MTTIKDYLTDLSNSETTTETDDARILNLLHGFGFNKAVVVAGIVYIDGKGTIQNPPTSIQNICKTILKVYGEVTE